MTHPKGCTHLKFKGMRNMPCSGSGLVESQGFDRFERLPDSDIPFSLTLNEPIPLCCCWLQTLANPVSCLHLINPLVAHACLLKNSTLPATNFHHLVTCKIMCCTAAAVPTAPGNNSALLPVQWCASPDSDQMQPNPPLSPPFYLTPPTPLLSDS